MGSNFTLSSPSSTLLCISILRLDIALHLTHLAWPLLYVNLQASLVVGAATASCHRQLQLQLQLPHPVALHIAPDSCTLCSCIPHAILIVSLCQ